MDVAVCIVCLMLFSFAGWHASVSDRGLVVQFQQKHPEVVIHDRWRFSSWTDAYEKFKQIAIPYGYTRMADADGLSREEQRVRSNRLALKVLTRGMARYRLRQRRKSALDASLEVARGQRAAQ